MNKVKCPHCNNVSFMNDNIKVCVFKCLCCGKDVTLNNKGVCATVQIPNVVYLVMLDIKNCDNELIETRCIGVFKEKKKANLFADICDTDKLIKYAYHYSNCYIVSMEVK